MPLLYVSDQRLWTINMWDPSVPREVFPTYSGTRTSDRGHMLQSDDAIAVPRGKS